jgi:hypothetical protein
VLQAAPPGVEGGGGDALAVTEGGDGEAAAAEAFEALLPALAGGGVGSSAGPRCSRHGASSQRQGRATSLLNLSRTWFAERVRRKVIDMGIKGFGLFNQLTKKGFKATDMGLHGTPGDVTRLSYRVRIVKAFRGMKLDGVSDKTAKGYDAFTLIFLTHSAPEQYLHITGRALGDIEGAHKVLQSEQVIAGFFELDKDGKLFEFLQKRLLHKQLQKRFAECRAGRCHNVGVISAVIRHIFVHGHLAANSNEIKPGKVYQACQQVSRFLLDFMDSEFESRMLELARNNNML